jgi:hypothetical protein
MKAARSKYPRRCLNDLGRTAALGSIASDRRKRDDVHLIARLGFAGS